MQTTLQLNDGNRIPLIGFGTYDATESEGTAAVRMALETGYRLIDTATLYQNEVAVGKGIKEASVPRDELFVTTKLWRDQLNYDAAYRELETSMRKLDVDYIDLYLIHWPANVKNYPDWKHANAEAWRAFEDMQSEGMIRSIGVSNFWQEHLEALFQTARVRPAVNQIEFHPGYWQKEVTAYCKEQGIVVESWSPLAQGRVLKDLDLQALAHKYNKSVAQVCLRWVNQHEVVVIPKSSNPQRIKENIDLFDFELSPAEMLQINQLPQMGFSGELPNNWPD